MSNLLNFINAVNNTLQMQQILAHLEADESEIVSHSTSQKQRTYKTYVKHRSLENAQGSYLTKITYKKKTTKIHTHSTCDSGWLLREATL